MYIYEQTLPHVTAASLVLIYTLSAPSAATITTDMTASNNTQKLIQNRRVE